MKIEIPFLEKNKPERFEVMIYKDYFKSADEARSTLMDLTDYINSLGYKIIAEKRSDEQLCAQDGNTGEIIITEFSHNKEVWILEKETAP